jgi:hypothetical protein
MAIPFRPLAAARPRVLPTTGNAFGQFSRNLYDGFRSGHARAQEDEVPDLLTAASRVFGTPALGDLAAPPEAAPWGEEAWGLLEQMMRNPGTRDLAMQIAARGPR